MAPKQYMGKWYINYLNERSGVIDEMTRVVKDGVVYYRVRWTADNDSHIKAGYVELVPRADLLNIMPLTEKNNDA